MAPQPPEPVEPPEPPEPATAREPRFLTLADVAEILATSVSQVRALVKSRELRAIQIGGRGQWRVETVELEKFIARMYEQADARDAMGDDSDDLRGAREDTADRVDERLG